jgi:hypothetical protein
MESSDWIALIAVIIAAVSLIATIVEVMPVGQMFAQERKASTSTAVAPPVPSHDWRARRQPP